MSTMSIEEQVVLLKSMSIDAETISILLKSLTADEFDRERLIRCYKFIMNVLVKCYPPSIKMVTKDDLHTVCSDVFATELTKAAKSVKSVQKPTNKVKKAVKAAKVDKPSPKKRKKTSTPRKKPSTVKKKVKTVKKTIIRQPNVSKVANPQKKTILNNECLLNVENITTIRDDIKNERTYVSENDKDRRISSHCPSWKNIYYANYIIGREMPTYKKVIANVVEIYFDDRSQQLILSCNYERKSSDINCFIVLSDYASIAKMHISKNTKNALIVLFTLIKETGLVRELSQDDDMFGVKDKIIQVHS